MIISPTDLATTITKLKNDNEHNAKVLGLSLDGFYPIDPNTGNKDNKRACKAMSLLLNHAALTEVGSQGRLLAERIIVGDAGLFKKKSTTTGLGPNKKTRVKIKCNYSYVTLKMAEDIVVANSTLLKPAGLKVSKREVKLIFPESGPEKVKFKYLRKSIKAKKPSMPGNVPSQQLKNALQAPGSVHDIDGDKSKKHHVQPDPLKPDNRDLGMRESRQDLSRDIDTSSETSDGQAEIHHQNQNVRVDGDGDDMNRYLEEAQRTALQNEAPAQAQQIVPQTVLQDPPRVALRPTLPLSDTQSLVVGEALYIMQRAGIPCNPSDPSSMRRLNYLMQSLSMNDAEDYPDATQTNANVDMYNSPDDTQANDDSDNEDMYN